MACVRHTKVVELAETGGAMEVTGFGFAGAAGIATSHAAVVTLTGIGLAVTPLGWVILDRSGCNNRSM